MLLILDAITHQLYQIIGNTSYATTVNHVSENRQKDSNFNLADDHELHII